MTDYLIFCIIGRVCVFLLQKFPFKKVILVRNLLKEGKFLHDLFECDLCLGVWVFWVLAFIMKMNILQESSYIPVVSELITGGVTSFLVHLVKLGWEAKFSVIEVK